MIVQVDVDVVLLMTIISIVLFVVEIIVAYNCKGRIYPLIATLMLAFAGIIISVIGLCLMSYCKIFPTNSKCATIIMIIGIINLFVLGFSSVGIGRSLEQSDK